MLMKKWIKENLVLVSGIVLPLLLVLGFFILSNAPRLLADPPEYDFLLIGYRYDYQHPINYTLKFEVRDGKLSGKAIPNDKDTNYGNQQLASIFRYRAETNTFEELLFDLPEELDSADEPISLNLTSTNQFELDKRNKSPDGFQFEYRGYRGRGGLLGEIFGMRRRYESNFVLKKNSAYFDLPKPAADPYYQPDLHFMGWIVSDGKSP
jgi:hypothetical protein